jgi:hypothetical protein
MPVSQYKNLLRVLVVIFLPALVSAESVYETHAQFLNRAFSNEPPPPAVIWLSGERKSVVRQLLDHDYPALRLRYWCRNSRSAWVLEEIGKELPITVGIIIERDYINSVRVLTYRENRGGEVASASFSDQFDGVSLADNGTLDSRIDGITGATLSVQALTRLATMALVLHTDSGCNDGT